MGEGKRRGERGEGRGERAIDEVGGEGKGRRERDK